MDFERGNEAEQEQQYIEFERQDEENTMAATANHTAKAIDAALAERTEKSAVATRYAAMAKALKVMVLDGGIRAYLAVLDPQALKQAQAALGMESYDPLPDLRDMQVILTALRNDDRDAPGTPATVRREKLIERIEIGMAPLAAREDKVNAEEQIREDKKATLAGDDEFLDGAYTED